MPLLTFKLVMVAPVPAILAIVAMPVMLAFLIVVMPVKFALRAVNSSKTKSSAT